VKERGGSGVLRGIEETGMVTGSVMTSIFSSFVNEYNGLQLIRDMVLLKHPKAPIISPNITA
jgi:hypothetical protein